MRVESGTCNVCSAPCSSCMHYGLSLSAIDSISESGFSSSLCTRKKTKSPFFNVDSMPISKVRICDDLHNAETSNFLSTSSSHDSYSEIAESKTNLRVSIATEVLSSGEIFEQGPCMRKPDQDCTTPYVHLSSDSCQRFHPGLGEGHCESECHGDGILLTCGGTGAKVTARDGMVDIKKEDIACSDVAISSFMKMSSPAVPGYGFQECETGENQWNSSGSNASINASSLDSNSYSASGCTGASVKPQNPLCRNDVSSKICSLRSKSQAETSPCLKYVSKDIEVITNLQPKEEITSFSEVDNVESSLAPLPSRSFSEHRSSSFTNHEAQKRMLFSSCNSNIDDLCKESMNDTDLDKQFDNDLGSNVHEPFKKDSAVLSATKGQDDHLQPLVVSEGGQSESDAVLYDVKVCDICGDAGREDLLATCSRCNDGAEHTYCMREKMDKVPDGDWLCEECKIKTENRDVDQSEAASVRLKPTCFNEINHNSVSTFIPRKRPKLVDRTAGLDVQGWSKGLQSPNTLTRRQANHLQEAKSLDVGHSAEITSPMKQAILYRQASLKSRDLGKLKTAIAAPSPEVWSAKVSEAVSLSKTFFRSSSFKSQPNLHSPHGNISRSVSFSKLNFNPKAKNNIENDPDKQKITRDLTCNDLREQGSMNSVTKFTSFKSTNLGGLNTESGSNGSFHQSRIGEIKRPKELQERNLVEKKSFSAVGDSFFTSSSGIATNSIPNVDSKFLLSGCNMNNLSETDSRCLSKGSDDTSDFGADGGKKQITYSSKISGFSNGISRLDNAQKSKLLEEDIHMSTIAGDESCHIVDNEFQRTVVLPKEFAQNRMSGSTMLVSSRTLARDDNRTVHCKRCNGTEHMTQHCTIDKVGESSRKHAADWNSREVVKGHNRCREAVVTLRNRESKNNKTDITGELPSVTVDLISDVPSNFTPRGSCQTNVPLVVERRKDKDSLKDLDVHPIKPIEATSLDQQLDIPLVPKPAIYNDSATVTEATRAETSVLVKPFRAFTFPKLEYIWQGSFNVLGTRSIHEMFYGIQAHISTCASNKVFEVATKLPNNIQLDEISYSSSWKAQCQVITPQEENIALFFFAKDIDSYERSYRKLMEKMHRNDTALRGNIDEAELLVFSSNKLSLSSQCWNSMHYLWGMFRVKRRNSIPSMGKKKPSLPNLNVNLISSDDLSIPCIERVRSSTKNLEGSLKLNRLPESSPRSSIPGDSTDIVDNLHSIASNIEDTICGKIGPLVWNCSNQDAENLKVSVEHVSSPVGGLSRTTAMPLVVESRLQNSTPTSGSKEETVGTCQKKLNDCTKREAVDSPALPCINAESSLTPLAAVPGAECSEIDAKMEDNKCSSSAVGIMDDNPKASVPQTDYLSNESNNSRKHSRSCSMERTSQPHVEFSNDTDEMERRKKTCNTFGSSIFDYNLSPQFSPKVNQLYSSICKQEQGECSYSEPLFPRNTATAERCFFPMDMGLLRTTKSSDADTPQLSTPDLELALGSKSRLTKSAAIPFLSFNVGNQHLEPGSTGDDGGDVSASLSLSLTLS